MGRWWWRGWWFVLAVLFVLGIMLVFPDVIAEPALMLRQFPGL